MSVFRIFPEVPMEGENSNGLRGLFTARAATTVATQRSDFNANLESSQRRHSNEKRTPTLPDARLEEQA